MTTATAVSPLALLGGSKSVTKEPGDIFNWPIVTKEDEDAVVAVLRRGAMSGSEITMEFEKEFNIDIPDEDAEKLRTVGDAIGYLNQKVGSGA